MKSRASSAAAAWTTSSAEPLRKTTAWRTARSSGLMPSSGGIRGKTAAPSGTSSAALMSASGHGGDDGQLVAVLDGRAQAVQVADVLVVEVDVDEAAQLPLVEQPFGDARELPAEVVKHRLHGGPCRLHLRLAAGVLPHRRRYLNT